MLNAEKITKSLSSKDLIKAFKLSLCMIEKLGDMIHNSQVTKDDEDEDENKISDKKNLATDVPFNNSVSNLHQDNVENNTLKASNNLNHFDFFCLANNTLNHQQKNQPVHDESVSSPQNSSSSQNSIDENEEIVGKRPRFDVETNDKSKINDAQSVELRHWRVANADKLNSLIDDCEKHVDGRKVYKCKFCAKVYEIKSSMRYHMKIIHLQLHLKTTEMQCRICGKQFTCISAVNRHQSKCSMALNHQEKLSHSNLSSKVTHQSLMRQSKATSSVESSPPPSTTLNDQGSMEQVDKKTFQNASPSLGLNKMMNPLLWGNVLNNQQTASHIPTFSNKFLSMYSELTSGNLETSTNSFEELLSNLTSSLTTNKSPSQLGSDNASNNNELTQHLISSNNNQPDMTNPNNLALLKSLTTSQLFSAYLNSTNQNINKTDDDKTTMKIPRKFDDDMVIDEENEGTINTNDDEEYEGEEDEDNDDEEEDKEKINDQGSDPCQSDSDDIPPSRRRKQSTVTLTSGEPDKDEVASSSSGTKKIQSSRRLVNLTQFV